MIRWLIAALVSGCLGLGLAGVARGSPTPRDGFGDCRSWPTAEPALAPDEDLRCLQAIRQSGRFDALSTDDLDAKLNQHYVEAALSGSRASAAIVKLLADEKSHRAAVPARHRATAFAAFLAAGEVAEAEEERRTQRLELPPLDLTSLLGARAPQPFAAKYWTFVGHGEAMREGSIDLLHGPHVVVYSAPGCGFCKVAAEALLAEPKFASLFQHRAFWISVPDGNFQRRYFQSWAHQHPSFPMHVIFDRTGWPRPSLAATPVFIFMRDGHVLDEIIGWRDEDRARFDEDLQLLR